MGSTGAGVGAGLNVRAGTGVGVAANETVGTGVAVDAGATMGAVFGFGFAGFSKLVMMRCQACLGDSSL
ncbi:MAG TPA: hypothetical protein VFA65_03065 [Bryobacteraceae bacterium]|nr:hypothetical protein [Bryobacteraceae bacterium]